MTQPSRSAQTTLSRVQGDELGGTDISSSIRSRNRRLPPGGPQELLRSTTGNGTATSSPSGSRAASPIPSKHPSRYAAGDAGGNNGVIGRSSSAGPSKLGTGVGGLGSGNGLLDGGWGAGWSRLQGLANSVLGVDLNGNGSEATKDDGLKSYMSKVISGKKSPGFWPATGTWGAPEPLAKKTDVIGSGSTEEREAAVRAKKMARILEGRDMIDNALDMNGHMKRRTSMEEVRLESEEDGDALVYIHQVKPQDNLAGVTLKYNCQPAVFRKANRFWPNDSIQTRKLVVLPVDACSVRGRPCDPPSPAKPPISPNLLASESSTNDASPFKQEPAFSLGMDTSAEYSEAEEERPWTHVRWVRLDSNPTSQPVEIARMPRKTLGYFPPRRRKSQSTLSAGDTPRASLDWSRSPQLLSQSLDLPSTEENDSPRMSFSGSAPAHSRHGSFAQGSRNRRESVTQAAERLGWMTGPGGVGTLGKNVRKPGPARDALNKWANKHVPGIAIDSLPSASILDSEGVSFGFKTELAKIAEGRYDPIVSGTVTPNGTNQGMGLENAAAAVEGWFRKLAANAPGTPKLSGVRRVESSDLIELLDGNGSDDGRGFELAPGTLRSSPVGTVGREDLEGVLRGKDKAGAKGGKSD